MRRALLLLAPVFLAGIPPLGAQEGNPEAGANANAAPPFATIASVEASSVAEGFSIVLTGTAKVPPRTSLLLTIRFGGMDLTQYWTRCYVDAKEGMRFELTPSARKLLAGAYTFDVSLDPTVQDLSVEPFFRGTSGIRHVTLTKRLGTAEAEVRDRSDVQAHFKKVLDAFEASLQELLDTSAAMKAGKKFASSGSGKIDGAAFNAWSEDFRVRVLACKQEHQEYLDGVFAHYYPQETIFTTPALFGLMDIVCFYELVPLCKKYRVILPEWLFEIKRSCEGVPMLPPEEAVLRGIRRDLRLIREGVGLLPATYALKDAALSREKIEEMKKSEEGEPLRAFDWAPVPEALATLSTEMPHLFPEPELRRVKDLAALTYPGIPVDSVRACYLASLVESPAPTDPKAPPARLRVLGLEYETREIALTERDRLATQLDHPPGRMAFAMQKNTVVVAVIYEGPPERVAAWQYLNTWFAMHME